MIENETTKVATPKEETKEKTNFLEDLTGKDFGFIHVDGYAGKSAGGRSIWNCTCTNCNKKLVVEGTNLKTGNTKSCGCTRGISDIKGEPGEIFGDFKCIKFDHIGSADGAEYLYECTKCGFQKVYPRAKLKKGQGIKCRNCGLPRSVKDISANYYYDNYGLFDLYQYPNFFDQLLTYSEFRRRSNSRYSDIKNSLYKLRYYTEIYYDKSGKLCDYFIYDDWSLYEKMGECKLISFKDFFIDSYTMATNLGHIQFDSCVVNFRKTVLESITGYNGKHLDDYLRKLNVKSKYWN